MFEEKPHICPRCKGSRVDHKGDACPTCDGEGVLWRKAKSSAPQQKKCSACGQLWAPGHRCSAASEPITVIDP